MFKVSVIIPAYKAGRFIKDALESVIPLEEVHEILVVIDGNLDNTSDIVKDYMLVSDKVKMLFHPNKSNRGASESRNLGITNAKCEFLSFLDADDFYLPGRFAETKKVYEENTDIDGVYEAIGTFYEDEISRSLHYRRIDEMRTEGYNKEMTTIIKKIKPEDLFEALLIGRCGWFHFNGLTVKKRIIDRTGLLDTNMKVGEDSEFFYRVALNARLSGGQLHRPVAMRRVYEGNGTLSVYTSDERLKLDNENNAYMWKKLFHLMLKSKFSKGVNRYLLNRYLDYFNHKIMNMKIGWRRKLYKMSILFILFLRHPSLFKKVIFN